ALSLRPSLPRRRSIDNIKPLIRRAPPQGQLSQSVRLHLGAGRCIDRWALDRWQKRGAIESPDGPQRIRGLAGSGKTVILALKAAYFHALHPDWRIALTFQTRRDLSISNLSISCAA